MAEEFVASLAVMGYGLQDLAAWHWILSGNTAEDAATRFENFMRTSTGISTDFQPVPVFIFSRVLLRNDVGSRALYRLLRQAWQILESSKQRQIETDTRSTQKPLKSIGLDAAMVLIVRLLRHARRVWPAVCVQIAQLWITYAGASQVAKVPGQDVRLEKDAIRLSFYYNRVLSLLALPPNESPYRSLRYRQSAQFMVIRQMNDIDPPLTISREGYRAVVRVQLAHRKTRQEQTWARLKARSWPPWKEDKLGVDASIGVEYGVSRASASLRRMMEAGYGPLDWEKSAGILAGWDTDQSPTIQTRSVAIPSGFSHTSDGLQQAMSQTGAERSEMDTDAIWVARIRATRTLQEAWTCFLACKNQRVCLTSQVYHAIFEKVVFERKRERGHMYGGPHPQAVTGNSSPLPGDGKEVFEPSSSRNQALSTQEPIPSYGQLCQRMINDRVRPSGRLLAFLLSRATTYDHGMRLLEVSNLSDSIKRVLAPWKVPPVPDVGDLLQSIPEWFFAAHVYLPPWTSLLRLLAQPTTVIVAQETSLDDYAQAIPKFHKACQVVECMDTMGMDLDYAGFRFLCRAFEQALLSARHIHAASHNHGERRRAQIILEDGLALIKPRFWRLFQPIEGPPEGNTILSGRDSPLPSSEPSAKQIPQYPRLFRVPHPAQLHTYLRLLGRYPDYDGIVDLIRWASTFSSEIMEEAKETQNGLRDMRICLTAARAFIEQPLVDYDDVRKRSEKVTTLYEVGIKRVKKVIHSFLTTTLRSRRKSPEPLQATPFEKTNEDKLPAPLIRVSDVPAPHTGYVRILTLNSPHNRNAISRQLLSELRAQIVNLSALGKKDQRIIRNDNLEAANGGGIRALIIGSEVQGVFCAGADLKERKTMTNKETNDFLHLLRETLDMLYESLIPSISAVHGVALGGGLELALATHFRVFTPAALVGLPETRLGIIPGAGGVPRLMDLLGRTRASDMIFTGRQIRGKEAFKIGLCDRLCDLSSKDSAPRFHEDHMLHGEPLAGALKMAREICEGGPATTAPLMRMMKSPDPAANEEETYNTVLKTQDRDEALRAFAEKRKPVFTGK
ncbi:MAG: hypothetical protein Q9219_004297 [cf. Caloplaca sp. 3 TL-2023]